MYPFFYAVLFLNKPIKNMKIQVPTDLNDITVGQYQRFMAANGEGAEEDFLLFKTIEIFCDVDIKVVSQFPLSTAQELVEEITAVLNQEKSFQESFEFEGQEYAFVPDLEALTIGEYIDLESGLGNVKDLHKAAAVMFRPVKSRKGELYSVEPYGGTNAEVHKAKEFPVGAVSAGVVFFYSIANELLRAFRLSSLRQQMKKESETIAESLSSLKSGAGITQSMHSLEEMLVESKKRQKSITSQP